MQYGSRAILSPKNTIPMTIIIGAYPDNNAPYTLLYFSLYCASRLHSLLRSASRTLLSIRTARPIRTKGISLRRTKLYMVCGESDKYLAALCTVISLSILHINLSLIYTIDNTKCKCYCIYYWYALRPI